MPAAVSTSAIASSAPLATVAPAEEQRMLLYVSYAEYLRIREALGDRATPRMTYRSDFLELDFPSRRYVCGSTNARSPASRLTHPAARSATSSSAVVTGSEHVLPRHTYAAGTFEAAVSTLPSARAAQAAREAASVGSSQAMTRLGT